MKSSIQAVAAAAAFMAAALSVAGPAIGAEPGETMFDEKTYRSLVAESKATQVGDLLTVIVHESSTAVSTADLRGQRSFSLSAQTSIPRKGPDFTPSGSVGTATESDGVGRTQRSGRLLAQLSVRVVELLPNGDLVVTGQQRLRINGEEQLITLSGVVRPRDISEGNTVLSSRIAQAQIEFDGKGFVTDQSKPGWLARLFAFLGL